MTYEPALAGERLCTIREIAERASLGVGSVHRALNGGDLVSPATRRLVIDTVRQLNEEKIARAARAPDRHDIESRPAG